jgi:hypothetical protein
MSERFAGEIRIGGPVPRSLVVRGHLFLGRLAACGVPPPGLVC